MNKNMTIIMNASVRNRFSLVTKAIEVLNNSVQPLSKYYSAVLERDINGRQTWHLLHAQLAFFMVAFPVECPLLLRMAFAAWFVLSVRLCKQELSSSEK